MHTSGTASDYRDLLERLHAFLTENGSAFGLTYAGVGDMAMSGLRGGPDSVAETVTVTWTDSDGGRFIVTGSVTGSWAGASLDTPYEDPSGRGAFLISSGSIAPEEGDVFTFSTTPPWTALRALPGALVNASQGNTGIYAVENLVDGKLASETITNRDWEVSSATLPLWVEFEFPTAETIAEYAFLPGSSPNYGPKSWALQYWDGDEWLDLDTQTDQGGWVSGQWVAYAIASPVAATKYRWNITAALSTNVHVGAFALRRTVGGVNAAVSQYIWSAPGNDGEQTIFVGVHAFYHRQADYYDWELAGFDGYLASAEWRAQLGCHRRMILPLWNTLIPYWFVANGRRALVTAKVNLQYEPAYLGFIEPYFTPNQLPYPLAVGCALALGPILPYSDDIGFRHTATGPKHVGYPFSDPYSGSDGDASWFQMQARMLDGTWKGFEARVNDTTWSAPAATRGILLPYRDGMTDLDPDLDGNYSMWPVELNDGAPNTFGRLDGVRALTGAGLTAETLVRVGVVDWLALPNINRIDRDDWFAMELD